MTLYVPFRFDLQAGTTERRILMAEVADWLRECVGQGVFLMDGAKYDDDIFAWYIATHNDHFKVLLRDESAVTLFTLRWS